MMYAKTAAELDTASQELFNRTSEDDDPRLAYCNRVETFLQRGDEWLAVRRQNIITRGNNTNNFSEATMRVLKDIILKRTKAFNVVALVDFCSTVLQSYAVKRLLSFAYGRRADPRLQYAELCSRMQHISVQKAVAIDNFRYAVPSSRDDNMMYTVDAEFGLCACMRGMAGAFCKHQAFVHDRFNVPFPNAPAVTADDRYALAQLALGEKCPNRLFFSNMRDISMPEQSAGCDVTEAASASATHSAAVVTPGASEAQVTDASATVTAVQNELRQ